MDVWCAIRTYPKHATELGNPIPSEPVFFLKPSSSITGFSIIDSNGQDLHHELELVVKLGENLKPESMTVGLDLTKRGLQNSLKNERLPWTEAKGFKNSAVIGDWVKFSPSASYSLEINKKTVQKGSIDELTWSVEELIDKLGKWAPLKEGDILFTGTPEGVGPLCMGDELKASLFVDEELILQHCGNVT